MTAHEEMLAAAKTLVRTKGRNEFSPKELIEVLKKSGSTYKVSKIYPEMLRCCINCPREGETPHDYFKRIKKGKYQLIEDLKK